MRAWLVLLMLAPAVAGAEPPKRLEFFAQLTHISDLMRGPPFASSHGHEPTLNMVAGGVTISAGAWELDLSQGYKAQSCGGVTGCNWETGTQLAVRFYPGRVK